MQTLKPEIESAILSAAEEQIFARGYKNATMRGIAEAVGISVSNLYLYFANKEALFRRIIAPFYTDFNQGLRSFLAHKDSRSELPVKMEILGNVLSEIISENSRQFVILFDRCQGTTYEKYRSEFVELLSTHMQEEIRTKISPALLITMTSNLLRCFIHVAQEGGDRATISKDIRVVLGYHMSGISSFF